MEIKASGDAENGFVVDLHDGDTHTTHTSFAATEQEAIAHALAERKGLLSEIEGDLAEIPEAIKAELHKLHDRIDHLRDGLTTGKAAPEPAEQEQPAETEQQAEPAEQHAADPETGTVH